MFEEWCAGLNLDPADANNLLVAKFITEKRQSGLPKESERVIKSSIASIYGKKVTKIP